MPRLLELITLIVVCTSGLARSSAEVRNDGATYETLCTYDDWCRTLKTDKGAYVPPKSEVIEVLRALNQPLLKAAQDLGVDPRAVAGAIIAGNSLGPQMDRDIRQFYDSVKQSPVANELMRVFRGQSFSIGLAQIKAETAGDAEPMLAKLERRPPRSINQITAALADPIESLKYATAIIRQCQDAYEKRGFEVAGDPALLATMYNVGGCPRRAAEAARLGRPPRLNFFGFFVRHYQEEISEGVGLDNPAVGPIERNSPKIVARRLKDEVRLANRPPKCPADAGVVSETTIVARGEFKNLAPGLDCDMKDWSLIETSRGEIGWLPTTSLNQNTEAFLREERGPCKSNLSGVCVERLRAQLGSEFMNVNDQGIVEARPVALKLLGKASSDRCVAAIFTTDQALVDGRGGRVVYTPSISPDRIQIKVKDGCTPPPTIDATLEPERSGATR